MGSLGLRAHARARARNKYHLFIFAAAGTDTLNVSPPCSPFFVRPSSPMYKYMTLKSNFMSFMFWILCKI
jgi:hypothetical protein